MFSSPARITAVLAFFLHSALSFSQNPDCKPPTFLKIWGNPDRGEYGNDLIRSGDGNLYLTGLADVKPFIQKTSFSGEAIWIREFEVDSLRPLNGIRIFEDSEGMIVGCGTLEYPAGASRGFVFRYNPVADSFLWAHSIESEEPHAAEILEKTPGGNYIYCQNPNTDFDVMFIDLEIELLELDRATGNIVPGFAKRYGYIYMDQLRKMLMTNGALYGVGTSTCRHDFGYKSNQLLLARFDPANGTPIWAQLSHADTNSVADFSAEDLAVDGNALVIAYTVSEDASNWPASIEPYYAYLQKTDLDGNILWIRKYELYNEYVRLLVVPDGYMLTCQRGVFKVNKNGDFLWGRRLPGIVLGSDVSFSGPRRAAIEADSLYLTGLFREDLGFLVEEDVYFWKMLADGSMSTSCDYVSSFHLDVIDVQNPVRTPVILGHFASPAIATAENVSRAPILMEEEILCPQYAPMSLTCPADIEVSVEPGTGGVPVTFNGPAGTSDCVCPGFEFTLTEGLSSGSLFPVGNTQVCFSAQDDCGLSASCCFSVKVQEEEEMPCDTKTIGCMAYDLLDITANAKQRRTYRIRVTNNCANKLTYTAIQLPNGLTAKYPPDNSVYTSPAGREYDVRNPNFSPFYSIRFKSATDGISNGESDVFEYTLPAQAQPAFIHITSRLEPQVYYEAHLNTFNCPIGAPPVQNRADRLQTATATFSLFPNPTSGELFADLSRWQGETLHVQILDSKGQRVQSFDLNGSGGAQVVPLRRQLPDGLYFLVIATENGEREVARFVLEW